MRRRNQDPKDETEQVHEVVPVITFAFVSVRLADSEGSNILARLAAAAYSPFEQQELWKQAELFFQKEMGCLGRVIKVQGDLQPAASYLILAPGVKLLPEVLVAAKKFMTTCTSFKTLKVQLQLGRSAVMDDTGKTF